MSLFFSCGSSDAANLEQQMSCNDRMKQVCTYMLVCFSFPLINIL